MSLTNNEIRFRIATIQDEIRSLEQEIRNRSFRLIQGRQINQRDNRRLLQLLEDLHNRENTLNYYRNLLQRDPSVVFLNRRTVRARRSTSTRRR